MKFFETKVETAYKTWDVHSETEHSALKMHFLGLNEAGWIILQLDPRFTDNPEIAYAIRSACINMANPDEESDVVGKESSLRNVKNSNSVIIEVKAEDFETLLIHLSYVNCITQEDANLISTELRSLHNELLNNSSAQIPTISLITDENHCTDHQRSFVH